MLDKLVRV